MAKPMPMVVMIIIVIAAVFYAGAGISMHKEVTVQEAAFHSLQQEYYSIDKTTRESAVTGSELTQQLVEIKNYPSDLLRLKLVGVGKILTGIFLILIGVLMALTMMPKKLGMVIKNSKKMKK